MHLFSIQDDQPPPQGKPWPPLQQGWVMGSEHPMDLGHKHWDSMEVFNSCKCCYKTLCSKGLTVIKIWFIATVWQSFELVIWIQKFKGRLDHISLRFQEADCVVNMTCMSLAEGPGHLSSSHCTLMASWPKQISGGKRLFAPLVTLRVWQRCWMGMWGKLVKEVNTKPKVTFPGGTKPSLYVERHSCKETRTNLVCDSGFTTCPHPHHLSSQGSFITRHLLQISATQRSIHEW